MIEILHRYLRTNSAFAKTIYEYVTPATLRRAGGEL